MSAKKLDKKQSEDALLAYIRSTNPNVFGKGGWKDNWTNGNGLGSALGMIGAVGSIGASAFNMANPDTSSIEEKVDTQVEAMKNQRNIGQFDSLDDLMAGWTSNRNLNTSFNADDYYNGPSTGDIITGTFNSTMSGATAGMTAGPWGALAGAVTGLGAGLIGGLTGRSKAKDAANEAAVKLANEARKTNNYRQQAYQTMAQNMVAKNNRDMFSQIAAYGGPLGISLLPVGGAVDYMQNEELLDTLGENKTKNNNSRISMPMFAFGGALGGYGGDWSNGLNFIKAGGTHGENPIGGVPMGVAQDGMPNLVEEGEVIWNGYVFSNRIKVPKKLVEKYKLKGDPTFAEAVEQIQKNSSERPNDPIEKRGLEAVLAEFMREQEKIRQRKAEKEQFDNMEDVAAFAVDGGPIHIAKNNKGTFTAVAKKHGMGVQEFASKVLANKENYSPAMVKKANFARNASKWHALGGHLFWPGGNITSPWNINGPLYKNESLFREEPKLGNNGFEKVILNNDIPTMLPFRMNGLQSPTDRYFGIYQSVNSNGNKKQTDPLPTSGWQTGLRYLPAIAPAISLGYSLFNGPDYSYADELDAAGNDYAEAIGNSGRVTPKFLGDYLAYDPFDRLFYANELGAQQAATNSAVMNQSSGNRGAALAGLLASGYNSNIGLGKLYREGEEYNRAQRERVAEFNRGTNQYNSTLDMQAQELNARANQAKAEALLNNKYRVLGMKQAIDNQRDQSISLALTNLFNNLGDIGWEAKQGYWLNALANSGYFGTPNASMYDIAYGRRKAACGGKLNRKKRKGLTI